MDLLSNFFTARAGLQALLVPLAFALVMVVGTGAYIYTQFETENRYVKEYGAGWKEPYEKQYGSIAETRGKMAIGIGGSIVVCGLAFLVYRMMAPQGAIKPRRGRRR